VNSKQENTFRIDGAWLVDSNDEGSTERQGLHSKTSVAGYSQAIPNHGA
jgi:hypothetical protein